MRRDWRRTAAGACAVVFTASPAHATSYGPLPFLIILGPVGFGAGILASAFALSAKNKNLRVVLGAVVAAVSFFIWRSWANEPAEDEVVLGLLFGSFAVGAAAAGLFYGFGKGAVWAGRQVKAEVDILRGKTEVPPAPVCVGNFTPTDFGKAASDYATHRKGFPDSFFKKLLDSGLLRPGMRTLDLGTGTGTLARGFARSGAQSVGLDITPELLDQAAKLAREEGVRVDFAQGRAEKTQFPDASFDLVAAGQCWHWFEGLKAAEEAYRLLKPGGLLLIAHFCYLPENKNAAQRTEDLILQKNPSWPLAGTDGRYERWREHMAPAGLKDIQTFEYDEDVPFTHEQWRGRIRACNGVLALQDPAKIKAFDAELAALLKAEFPKEPLVLPHRIFAIYGRK